MEFLKGITLSDLVYLVIIVGVAIALILSNFRVNGEPIHIYMAIAWAAVGIALFMKVFG